MSKRAKRCFVVFIMAVVLVAWWVPQPAGAISAPTSAGFAGFAPSPAGGGYWIARSNGKVEAYNVASFGDRSGQSLNAPIVGIAATASGNGYWLVASDGGIFSYGDAQFYGSMGGRSLNKPVIAMAATPSGHGYWLLASDGGVFSFGDAQFHGSTGGTQLSQPVVGMTATASGSGYWLVAADGGIFAYNAPYYGSMGGQHLNAPVVGVLRSDAGNGYRLVARDGGVFSFGDAQFYGSTGAYTGMPQMVGVTARVSHAAGYIVVGADGRTWQFGPDVATPPAGSSPACTVAGVTRPAANSTYKFEETRSDGTPVRWSPCLPIHWQMSSVEAPANVLPVLQTAFADLSTATGLQFVYDGTTTERISSRLNSMTNSDGTGKSILVDFESQTGAEMCGSAGCTYPEWTGSGRMITAAVVINKTLSLNWSTAGGSMGAVALHELGHAVGLDHVNDANEVMNPVTVNAFSNYAIGDKNGLWLLGAGSVPLSPYSN